MKSAYSYEYWDFSFWVPKGVSLFRRFLPRSREGRRMFFKISIFILTFITYVCYHMSRKPISVVRAVLYVEGCENKTTSAKECGWAPFNDAKTSKELLGGLDYAFMFPYAISLVICGQIAERSDLRYFLTIGMILGALFTSCLGFAYYLDIHSYFYFILIQILNGCVQATGWPAVIPLMSNWYGKGKRGVIMGLWNCHTSVGNIIGTLLASVWVETTWGTSFVVPGIIMGSFAIVMFLFIVPSPWMVNCEIEHYSRSKSDATTSEHVFSVRESESGGSDYEEEVLISKEKEADQPISFRRALLIPGVIEFALCLFFTKLVSYVFLFWLPEYIENETTLGEAEAAQMSIWFDVGGMIGGVSVGFLSDVLGIRGIPCVISLALAIPALLIYNIYISTVHQLVNVLLLLICGAFVNGPYALITTAVTADLGNHESLKNNAKATATVAGIIDATGSLGAGLGPFLTGWIAPTGWDNVFYMLIGSNAMAILLLSRVVYKDFWKLKYTCHSYIRM